MFSPPQQYMTVAEFSQALPTITAFTVFLSVASFFLLLGLIKLVGGVVRWLEDRAARRQREKFLQQMNQANLRAGLYDEDEIPY